MTRSIVGFVGALTLGLGGCGASGVWHVSGATTDEFAEVQAAADEWCSRTEGRFCPVLVSGPSSGQVLTLTDLEGVRRISGRDNLGGYCRAGSDIWIARNATGVSVRRIALHEFGHSSAAGRLEHTVNADAVMFERANNGVAHLTEIDLRDYCNSNGCSVVDGSVRW